MGKQSDTGISWCKYSFNPWWGCEAVSPACANCYAERWAKRCGYDVFGPGKPRRFFGERHWHELGKWNKLAEKEGKKEPVFCGSMCDIMDDHPKVGFHRKRLWMSIEENQNLIHMLLTKRPENFKRLLPKEWLSYPRENVWLGITAETQEWLDTRLKHLFSVPAASYFVSCEPLLGPIVFPQKALCPCSCYAWQPRNPHPDCAGQPVIDLIIAGCESKGHRRTSKTEWFESLRDQTRGNGVAFHLKQMDIDGEIVKKPKLGGKQYLEMPKVA